MPHNRDEVESTIKSDYDFYVPGGEYSVTHLVLAALDVYFTGGQNTAAFLKDEVEKYGIKLASAMATATPPVQPTEALIADKFVFQNWETFLGVKVPLPNKIVPYVAGRRKATPPAEPRPSILSWGFDWGSEVPSLPGARYHA
ncbi:hypothetical protein, partial [Aquisphaera insulae]|uniref:hypothetical protein n=1 Tax=Aquisphaera insulae TaxID=2712864 RepID=UPI0013EBD153